MEPNHVAPRRLAIYLLAALVSVAWAMPTLAETVRASWYERGTITASGEAFRPDALTCARPSFRPGHATYSVRVTHIGNGRSVVCRVNDRGPAAWTGNGIDLSRGAARVLGMISQGVARVRIEMVR